MYAAAAAIVENCRGPCQACDKLLPNAFPLVFDILQTLGDNCRST